MGGKKEGNQGRWVGRRLHLVRRSVCCCWGNEGNESVMMNGMKWGWKGFWGWYCCQRCLEEGKWVDWNRGLWMKGGKEMRNNEDGVGRGNEARFLRLVKVDWWRDSNEFELRSIVMWNGNEDEEGLNEVFEKGEVIEGIRGNGGEFVGIQPSGTCWMKVLPHLGRNKKPR